MKCMSVRNYLTARPKSAMAQLPSRLTSMFFVLMSLKNIMIGVYLVFMLLQIHRTLMQKTIILTKRPISMTDVLSLSAQNIVIFEPVGNGWLSFGAKDLCMKVGETLDSQSFHL